MHSISAGIATEAITRIAAEVASGIAVGIAVGIACVRGEQSASVKEMKDP